MGEHEPFGGWERDYDTNVTKLLIQAPFIQVRIGPCDQETMEKDGLALLSNYQSLRILLELSHSPDLSEFSFWDKLTKGKVEGTEASGQKSAD